MKKEITMIKIVLIASLFLVACGATPQEIEEAKVIGKIEVPTEYRLENPIWVVVFERIGFGPKYMHSDTGTVFSIRDKEIFGSCIVGDVMKIQFGNRGNIGEREVMGVFLKNGKYIDLSPTFFNAFRK